MPTKPVSHLAIQQRAVALIEDYLGSQTAKQYELFYADKNESQIISSIRALILEIVGPEKGARLMDEFFNIK